MACETCDARYGYWLASTGWIKKIECKGLTTVCEVFYCKKCGISCDHCDSLFCGESCYNKIALETYEYVKWQKFDDEEIIPGTFVECEN